MSFKIDEVWPALGQLDPVRDYTAIREITNSDGSSDLEIVAFVRRVDTAAEQTELAKIAGVSVMHHEDEPGLFVKFDGELWDAMTYKDFWTKRTTPKIES